MAKTKPEQRLYQYLLSGYLSFLGVEFDWFDKESMGSWVFVTQCFSFTNKYCHNFKMYIKLMSHWIIKSLPLRMWLMQEK